MQKLIEAASAVDRMKIVLTEKKVVVDAKTADVQALIAVIQEKSAIASTLYTFLGIDFELLNQQHFRRCQPRRSN